MDQAALQTPVPPAPNQPVLAQTPVQPQTVPTNPGSAVISTDPLAHLKHEIDELEKHTEQQEALAAQAVQAVSATPPPLSNAPQSPGGDPVNPFSLSQISQGINPAGLPNSYQGDDTTTQSPIQSIPQPVSTRDKERKDQMVGAPTPERAPMREISMEFEPPPEVQPYLEVKADPQTITLPTPIQDEYGELLLRAAALPKPKIILPLQEEELDKAFHHKVKDSIRWLAEWCKRVVLINPRRVFYN